MCLLNEREREKGGDSIMKDWGEGVREKGNGDGED